MSFAIDRGKFGEDKAVEYLESKGYKIIERNYKCRFGEIDVIARDGNEFVFVEVRTFCNGNLVEPVESVFRDKRKRLLYMVERYINERDIEGECRIDLVGINLERDGEVKKIKHIEDAFWGHRY